jgi:cytochrome c-type biogenesis protein
MDGAWFSVASALWLGILTSISPCPLATNIAAVSFISRRMLRPRTVVLTGLLYTLGRALTYLVLAWLLVASVLAAPQLSHFLQKYMNQLLGPVLILVGMVLLDLIPLRLPGGACGTGKLQQRAESAGIWGAGLLGAVFALTFCPVSAALFFGSLIPLAIKHESRLLLPSLYGIGTGLPVLAFAVLLAVGAETVARVFRKLTQFETWARRVTGGLFVATGLYYALAYILEVIP